METVSNKSVDRQATFDTDPNRARLTRGALKLPVIEGKDKGKDFSATTLSDNKSVQNASKEVKSVTSDNKLKSNKATDVRKEPPTTNTKSKGSNKRESNELPLETKTSEATRKSDILSNVNKKVTAPTTLNKTQNKDVRKSVDNSSEGSDTSKSDKPTNNNSGKTNTSVVKNKGEHTPKASDKSSGKTNTSVLKSSSPQTKVTGSKQTGKHESGKEVKPQASHKPTTNTNKDYKANESAKVVAKSESDNSVNHGTSRGPEKQTAKTSVLKDLNSKKNISPVKGSSQKNSNSTINESAGNKHTSKSQESNTPRNKDNPAKKVPISSQNKVDNDITVIKQTQKPQDSKNKESQVNKNNKSLKTVQNDNKQSNKPSGSVIQTKGDTINDESSKKVDISKQETTGTIPVISSAKSLPVNNAPTETHISNNEDKNASVSPRHNQTSEQSVKSSSQKYIPKELKTVKEELSEDINVNESSRSKARDSNDVPSIIEHLDEEEHKGDTIQATRATNESNDKRTLYSHNLRVPPPGEDAFDSADDITEKGLTTGVQNKHETYVVSPSVSKLNARSPRGNGHTNVGRLSPSNETIEPIRFEQKSEKVGMDVERKESYAQLYAERNTLLKAEITYRKRIKQLEEEANGFLKAIDELTTENRYLRGRVDALEDEVRGKGGMSAIDKISDLERDKAELENKLKRIEKESNENKTPDEVRNLKEQVVKLQSENHVINEENMKLKSENYETAKKLNALNSEKKSYSKSESSTDSENKQNSKQIRDLNAKIQRLEKKVNSLEFENKTLSETLAQKKSELGELLGVMKDENKFDDEIKELKDQVDKLTKDKKDAGQAHNKEKRQLNETIKELKSQLEAKIKESDELKIKLDEKEKETKKLKSSTDTTKKLADLQTVEIDKLKVENNRLNEEKDEYKEKYTIIVTESENATKDLGEAKDKIEQFNKDLQKIVSDKESQISKLINQLDAMRDEREQQRKVASEEREKLKSEKDKNEDHMKNIKRLETDLKHFVVKLDDAKIKENTLSTDLDDRNYEVSNLEKQVFELNMKMENHSKRMTDLDREKREMEREKREWDVKKDKLDDIESSNKRLMEENRRLRNQIEMSSIGNQSDYRMPDRPVDEKPVVEAWVNIKDIPSHSQAIYVQKDKTRDRTKRVQLVQPSIQKKRQPFSKSSPVKQSRQTKGQEQKTSNQNTHRSMEDLRKVADTRTPESEHSLPELSHDARLTLGYTGFGGYREIHKNRIRAAHKRVY